jgi:hypothetical protein
MREMVNRLPTTDEAKIVRQMFEVEAGYPDVVGDNWLWERIKERYLRKLDSFCDVLATGKSDVGRHVMRVRPDAPKSHVTGQPLPDFTLAVAPLSPWSNPTRVERENRAICEAHTFVDPEPYPLFVKGLRMPTALKSRVQTVMVAIMDVPGHNVFIADAETAEEFGVEIGDEICLDALLVTPTGRARLTVMQRENLLLPAEKYLPRREEFMQYPGFQEEEIPDLVETMLDGTAVFAMQYRVSWDVPVRCRYDKVKWLQGGIKAVCRPVRQFFTEIDGEKVPIDVIVSEKALLSKGGVRDGVASALAALAGMTEIDPSWSFAELCQQIETALVAKGLPRDGRLQIFLRHSVPQRKEPMVDAEQRETLENLGFFQREYEEIGEAVCGPIAVIRTQETERRQSSVKTGMRMNIQARALSGAPFPHDEKVGALVESYARAYQNASEAAASEAVATVA